MSRPVAGGEDAGAVAVVTAAFAVVLFGFAAIIVDLGMARQLRWESQDAVDAAVLAGASTLYADGEAGLDQAAAAVVDLATANLPAGTATGQDWTDCRPTAEPPDGSYPSNLSECIRFVGDAGPDGAGPLTGPRAVWVQLPVRPSPVALGGIFGYDGLDVVAVAEAEVSQDYHPTPCVLCVVESLEVDDAEIRVRGGGSVEAGELDHADGSVVVAPPGDVRETEVQGTVDPTPPLPPGLVARDAVPDCDTTLEPGVYQEIRVRAGTCTLADGVYVVTDRLELTEDSSTLSADAVTIVLTPGAMLEVRSGGTASFGGDVQAGSARLVVTGAGSSVEVRGPVAVGSVEVKDGAQLLVDHLVTAPPSDPPAIALSQ